MKKIPTFSTFEFRGVHALTYHAAKGEGLPKHVHEFAHTLQCHVGSCVVRIEGREVIVTPKSRPLILPANVPHEIEALQDGTVFQTLLPAR